MLHFLLYCSSILFQEMIMFLSTCHDVSEVVLSSQIRLYHTFCHLNTFFFNPQLTLVTFLVSRPKWTLVGLGLGLLFLRSLSSPLFCVFDLQNHKRYKIIDWFYHDLKQAWIQDIIEYNYCVAEIEKETHADRERRRLSWRLRLGLGEPEELEEEERELEEPERLEPEELDPLEEPELEPELLLEVELDLDLFSIKEKTG